MEENIHFRYMRPEDIHDVMQVEHTVFTSPWTESAFYYELFHNRFATYFVVEIDGSIIGYCGVWVVLDEANITNIALLPGHRGNKIGESLFRTAIHYAKLRGAKKMSLEVRVSNTAAQSLYRKFGFQEGGIRKNYYADNFEDALVMWVIL